MLLPAVSMAAHVITSLRDRFCCRCIALQRQRARKHCQRKLAFLENAVDTPEPNPAAVFELGFCCEIAALQSLRADFSECRFAVIITIGKGRLGTLLEVHDQVERKPRTIR